MNHISNFEKLNENNYDTWSLQMRSVLINADLWKVVSGSLPNENSNSNNSWTQNDEKALAHLILHVSSSQLTYIKRCTTSKDAWQRLKDVHLPSGPIRKVSLYKKLINVRMNDNENMPSYINSFVEVIDKLEEVDIKLTEELKVIMLLSSLSAAYENFVVAIESRDSLPKFDTIKLKLLEEGARREQKPNQEGSQAFFIQNKNKNNNKFLGKCYNCGKRGHMSAQCKSKTQNIKQKSQHLSYAAFMANENFNLSKGVWCLDSGATSHMCCDKSWFSSFVEKKDNIMLAADSTTTSLGIGTVFLKTDVCMLELKNVLFVPSLQTNFFSVSKALQNGHSVIFKKDVAVIKNKNGQHLFNAKLHNNLFLCENFVAERICYIKNDEVLKWHNRYGHLNFQSLKELVNKKLVNGINISSFPANLNLNCDTCNKSKITSTPFPKKSEKVTKNVLELIHTDVCGPMINPSVNGSRYFVTFIDDFSRRIFVFFLKTKDEVFEQFKVFKNLVECQTQKQIKALRSDNGREYVNNNFNKFLADCGIKRQLSVPYTPQQNGVAERANRTLVEMARSLLIHANLEEQLWAEAVATAAYIRNRSPTKSLLNLTPFEAWCGRKPKVNHLRVFGSKAFALDKNQHNKFQAKGHQYVFVGYSPTAKAYRLYDRSTKKVIERRDVKFVEEETNYVNSYEVVSHQNKVEVLETNNSDNNNKYLKIKEISGEDHSIQSSDVSDADDANISDDEFFTDSTTPEDDEVVDKENTITENEKNPDAPDKNIVNVNQQSTHEENTQRPRPGRPRIIRKGAPGRPRKEYVMLNLSDNDVIFDTPQTVQEALEGPNAIEWKESMKSEHDALISNDTWSLVDLPPKQKAIGTKWVFRIKRNESGKVDKFKSRLVAKGCNQQFGVNFWETFSPVIRYENIRLLYALAAEMKMFLYQMDISNAYLNGELSEEVYIKQPESFVDEKYPNRVLKLKKAIYGLKQSGRIWNITLDKVLRNINFKPCESEPCLYVNKNEQIHTLLAVYVDDIIIACSHKSYIQTIQNQIAKSFKVHDCGELKSFLGMEIRREGDVGTIHVSHKQYIKDLLLAYNMQQCRPAATPLDPGFKVSCNDKNCDQINVKNYQSLIGSLMYLAITTRPDIQFAVSMLAQRNSSPHREHEAGALHVLRYLSATANFNLTFYNTGDQVRGYVDADWAGDSSDRKSYSGYVFFFGGGPITWEAKKQSVVALSSTEAEYIALSTAAREAVYLRRLLDEVGWKINGPIELKGDNLSSHQLAENHINHKRTKHIDIRYHHVRQSIANNEIKLNYVSTNENTADLFTKLLQKQKHAYFVKLLGLNI